jgi:hypothetical protein
MRSASRLLRQSHYSGQLTRGADYDRLTATVVVAWLVQPLFPLHDRLWFTFELRDRHVPLLLSDHIAIHVLQLSALRPSPRAG